MPVDDGFDPSTADGGTLRTRYEAVLAEARTANAELATLRAGALIADKGFKYVKATDLAGVASDQIEAKATEIETAKLAERSELLKSILEENGITATDPNTGLQELLGRTQHDSTAQLSRLNGVGSLSGAAPPIVDTRALNPQDRMEAHFHKTSKKS